MSVAPEDMHMIHDQRFDLNLLRVLDAVLTEGSATGAGRRLGMSQSAVSHALTRAREAMGDPLLVRVRGALEPTPRALALREPLRRALTALDLAMSPPSIDPATWAGEVVVAAPDYTADLLLPGVAARLASELPGLDLVIVSPSDGLRKLVDGDVDLVLGRAGLDDGDGLYAQRLFDDGFCCLLRQGHPALDGPWDLDVFSALRHVLIAPGGRPGGAVDQLLAQRGRQRRVVVRVAHFMAAARFVAASDAVCTMPRRVGLAQAAVMGLAVREPPVEMPPFAISQMWHERAHHHPAHRVLRRVIVEVARSLG
jgi:DNA-binding transcriptional LysR family regulator